MTQTAYIDETTAEQLATVRRAAAGYRITLSPRLRALLRACAGEPDVPDAISSNVFYAHHHPDDGRSYRDFPVTLATRTQCLAALESLTRLDEAAREFLMQQP